MPISRRDLFFGFLKIGMMGFGGVAPVAHHVIVEDRKWLNDRDYAALLGFGQIIPGGNVTNMAVMLGMRNGGWLGVVLALTGLMAVPLAILLVLAQGYKHIESIPFVNHAVADMASVSGGLLIGTGLKSTIKAKINKAGMFFACLGFLAVVVFQISLVWVLLTLLPLSIWLEWRQRRPT